MASINASTSGAGGVITTADATGNLNLQTAGTTAVTLDTSQNATFAGKVTSAGALTLASNGSTTAVTIDASQNVGIGGTPKSTGVSGSLEFGPSTVGLITSQFDGPYFTSNLYYSGGWKYASTGYASMYAQYQSQHKWYTAPSGSANAATSLTQAMTLDSSGNLLVGCTSAPSASVSGIRLSNPTSIQSIFSTAPNTGAYTAIAFFNGNGQVGRIDTSGSSTVYVTSSDYRLKENIAPMTGALDKVALLKPVTYKWKIDGKSGDGFIAHELAEVCSDAVVGEKDAIDKEGEPLYQGIDTSFLVATLTAAIQEQQTLITSLTARITALEGA